jgi:uroporphyrinogen-III synthase
VRAALAGARVLVTRPAQQAEGLARRIAAAGGEAVCFPALTIEPVRDMTAVRAAVGDVGRYDVAVYVSRNAVEHGVALLEGAMAQRPRVAAIGPSTAAALEAAGVAVSIRPADGYTSEALLEEPALQDLRERRVLLVRGRGGRELLADTFVARGAQVVSAVVYARKAATGDTAALIARWEREGLDFVTALSVETLDALCTLLGQRGHALLAATPMVTASARVIKRAATLGFTRIVPAIGPDDGALVEAMAARRRTGGSASD